MEPSAYADRGLAKLSREVRRRERIEKWVGEIIEAFGPKLFIVESASVVVGEDETAVIEAIDNDFTGAVTVVTATDPARTLWSPGKF